MRHHPGLVAFSITALLLGSVALAAAQPDGTTTGSGDPIVKPQTAEVDTDFRALLAVPAAPGTLVHFVAPAEGASAVLAASAAIAGDRGLATVAARAGTIAGVYQVIAIGDDGVPLAAFVLSNTPGAAAVIVASPTSTPQHARVASDFAQPLAVSVRDRFGNGVPGATVTYSAPGRGCTGVPRVESTITDDNGHAQVGFNAGTIAGSYLVTASVAGVTTDAGFALTNLHGAPHHTVVESGDGQHAVATASFAEPVVVRVDDAYGNPVADAAVTVYVPETGATAHLAGDATAITDADGRVELSLTAGTVSGSVQVAASAALGAAPAMFTLHNDADVAASISALPGATPQTARVTDGFTERLAVAVVDRFGNPVSGAHVLFAASQGYAHVELEREDALTSDAGVAAVRARAGHIAGATQVTARVGGVNLEVLFELTQTAGRPAHVVVAEGGGQRTFINAAFPRPVVFRVVDAIGNAVSGATLTLTSPASGPTAYLIDGLPVTDATGAAVLEFAAGDEPGTVTIWATVDGAAAPSRLTFAVDPMPAADGADAPLNDELAADDLLDSNAGCSAAGGGEALGLVMSLVLTLLAMSRRRRYTMA